MNHLPNLISDLALIMICAGIITVLFNSDKNLPHSSIYANLASSGVKAFSGIDWKKLSNDLYFFWICLAYMIMLFYYFSTGTSRILHQFGKRNASFNCTAFRLIHLLACHNKHKYTPQNILQLILTYICFVWKINS